MPIRMDSRHDIHSTPTTTCSEQRQPLYLALIDLTRAFDTVDCQTLWSILSRHCYHEKYTRILRLVHAGMAVPQRSATAALTLDFHSENGGQTGMHYPRRAQSSKPRANLAPASLWCFIRKQQCHHCTPPRIPPGLTKCLSLDMQGSGCSLEHHKDLCPRSTSNHPAHHIIILAHIYGDKKWLLSLHQHYFFFLFPKLTLTMR